MKMIERTLRSQNLGCLLVLIFFITGCANLPTTSLQATATRTPNPLSKTATPSISPDLPPTVTPTWLPTETPTETLTFTPRPTLSIEEAKTLVLELVQEHENCQLPCLWGFTPGVSDLETAQAFVQQFGIGDFRADAIELGAHDYGDMGGIGISYLKNNVYIILSWSYYKEKENTLLELLTLHLRSMERLGIDPINQLPIVAPVYGDPTFNKELHDYLLPSILTTYGQPDQVLITVRPDEPENAHINYHPFSLALYYSETGIFIEYVMMRETKGSDYIGCPNKSHIYITVWDPNEELSLEYLVEKAGSEIALSILKPIDEATSLTMDEFYQNFKDPNNATCLETPAEIWILK
jgi:hypothetical protein